MDDALFRSIRTQDLRGERTNMVMLLRLRISAANRTDKRTNERKRQSNMSTHSADRLTLFDWPIVVGQTILSN
jgi:hypothetical protein